MIAPCMECHERYPGCHDVCEDYGTYRKSCERVAEYQKKHRVNAAQQLLSDGARRLQKRKRK